MLVVKTKFGPFGDITIQEHKDLFSSSIVRIGIVLTKLDKNYIELSMIEKCETLSFSYSPTNKTYQKVRKAQCGNTRNLLPLERKFRENSLQFSLLMCTLISRHFCEKNNESM